MKKPKMEVEEWPIDSLIEYARNPRENDDQVDRMCGAIKEYGFLLPILIERDGGVVDGHLRLKAARRLKMETVSVVFADGLSKTQVKAFRLLANQSTNWASWDEELLALEIKDLDEAGFDLDLTGFESADLDRYLEENDLDDSSADDDNAIPEPSSAPVTKVGDLWILGEHRLLCGDSTKSDDVERLMKGSRANLFATDPPYLVDYDGTNHPNGHHDKKGYKDWSGSYGNTWDDASQGPELYEGFISVAIDHAIDSHAAWYCWHASKRQSMVEAVWEKMGAFVHQQIIWKKNNPILTRTYYLWLHEPCFFGWIKGNRPPRLSGAKPTNTIWEMKSLAGPERPEHPTPKPLEAFGIPMRQHVDRGGICYEPFSGSGSQIMAGEENGRRVFAIEISPIYVDVTIKRYIKKTGRIVYLEGSSGKTFNDVAVERDVDLDDSDDFLPSDEAQTEKEEKKDGRLTNISKPLSTATH